MNDMQTFASREAFHASRARSIGSSDVPVLAGLTARYGSTPLSLWREKTGRGEPFAGNERTWWGTELESTILYRYVLDEHGAAAADDYRIDRARGAKNGTLVSEAQFRAPEYPWAVAHPDLVDLTDNDAPRIQEAKSTGMMAAMRRDDDDYGYGRDDRSLGGIPLSVYLQIQWQMLCAGIDTAGVSVLIDTSDYRAYGPGGAHKPTQERLLALAERFWWHVEHDTPPAPATWGDVVTLWPTTRDAFAVVSLDQEYQVGHDDGTPVMVRLVELFRERERLTARQKQDKRRLDDIQRAVGLLIGDNAKLQTDDGRVLASRYETKRETTSVKRLDEHDPELGQRLRDAGVITEHTITQLRIRTLKED